MRGTQGHDTCVRGKYVGNVIFLIRSTQKCVNTMPRRKDVSSDLREVIVVAQ